MRNNITITGCSLIDLVHAAYDLSHSLHSLARPLEDSEELSDQEVLTLIHFGIPFPVTIGDLKGRRVNLLVGTDGKGGSEIPGEWCEHSELQLKNLLLRIGVRYNFQEQRHEIGCGCTVCHLERVKLAPDLRSFVKSEELA